MTDPTFIAPVFRASFADFKLIKTRGVAQLIFELPVEQADAALQTLGGLPRAASEVWAGICRLDPTKPASEPRKGNREAAAKERRSFREMPLSQQAALSCNDERFQRFLAEKDQKWGPPYTPEVAAERVREICGVGSRSAIVDEEPSGKHWRRLNSEFMTWVHDVPLAGPTR